MAFLVGLVVGGVGWLPGAVYGLMLIILMLIMPGGFAGAVRIASFFLRKPSV